MSNVGGASESALVFFNGDIGRMENGKASLVGSAHLITAGSLQRGAHVWSRLYGGPYLEIGRVGTLGSSGHHLKERRLKLEVQVLAAALDALKERHGFKSFHMVGQSGGGHNVAALAEMRSDVGCAVMASAVLSVKSRELELGKVLGPRILASLDPADSVGKMQRKSGQRLIVLSDPDDQVVSFRSQLEFVDKVKAKGFPILHITAASGDEKFHGLSSTAHRAAIDCAKDVDDDALVKNYQNKNPARAGTSAAGR
jgi:hypothetical protein